MLSLSLHGSNLAIRAQLIIILSHVLAPLASNINVA